MQFKKLTLEDMPLIRSYSGLLRTNTCDYTPGCFMMWRNYFKEEYALDGNVLLTRLYDSKGNCCYNLPLGGELSAELEKLAGRARKSGEKLCFCTVPEEYLEDVLACGGEFEISEQREFFDYLYAASDLIELKGKKYSGQRNQISQFVRAFPEWSFERLSKKNLPEVMDYFETVHPLASDAMPSEAEDHAMTRQVLENTELYGMSGGVLRAGERIFGFALGEAIGDTLYVHIEKADRSVHGAYQTLVREFSREYAGGAVKYINREDDMGDEGLRTAKLALHPVRILKKYIVEVK